MRPQALDFGGDVAKKSMVYIGFWAACQAFRTAFFELMAGGSGAAVGLFVLVDKYTGPLGSAAVEIALLELLHHVRGGLALPFCAIVFCPSVGILHINENGVRG